MSKKLLLLVQTLLLFVTVSRAYARDMTVDIYQNGSNVGTMTIPEGQYSHLVDRMKGSNITVRPQPRPDADARRKAAEAQQERWKKQFEDRRVAAQAQQEKWKQQFEERHTAAQARQAQWNQEFEARHQAATEKQAQTIRENQTRRAAAEQRQEMWKQQYAGGQGMAQVLQSRFNYGSTSR